MNLDLQITVTYTEGQFNTRAIPNLQGITAPRPMIQQLIDEAEKLWGVPPGTVRSKRRTRDSVDPRHAVAYAARRMTKRSYPDIGRIMGGFDHSTIIHAERRAAEKRTTEPEFAALLARLMWNVRVKRREQRLAKPKEADREGEEVREKVEGDGWHSAQRSINIGNYK